MLRVLERLFCFLFKASVYASMGFPGGSEGKASAYNVGDLGSIPGLGRPLEKEMATTPALLPGKSHGWRSLVSYSPWGSKELDTTEQLHFLYVSWRTISSLNSENSSGLYLHATEGVGTGHSWS